MIDFSLTGDYKCPEWNDFPTTAFEATGGLLGRNAIICLSWKTYGGDSECYKMTAKSATVVGTLLYMSPELL